MCVHFYKLPFSLQKNIVTPKNLIPSLQAKGQLAVWRFFTFQINHIKESLKFLSSPALSEAFKVKFRLESKF